MKEIEQKIDVSQFLDHYQNKVKSKSISSSKYADLYEESPNKHVESADVIKHLKVFSLINPL